MAYGPLGRDPRRKPWGSEPITLKRLTYGFPNRAICIFCCWTREKIRLNEKTWVFIMIRPTPAVRSGIRSPLKASVSPFVIKCAYPTCGCFVGSVPASCATLPHTSLEQSWAHVRHSLVENFWWGSYRGKAAQMCEPWGATCAFTFNSWTKLCFWLQPIQSDRLS